MPKKLAIVLVSFAILLTSLATPTKAEAGFFQTLVEKIGLGRTAEVEVVNMVKSMEKGSLGKPSREDHSAGVISDTGTTLLLYTGAAGPNILGQLTPDQQKIMVDRFGTGAIGEIGSAIAYLYAPPASSERYIADLFQSAKIVPSAQAQGLGFASLDPILSTWKMFRNLAYFCFVVIFMVIGFMIMFRSKISGQTVVTAQQAIPQVIIALIMVTFSYAIAGFLIDLMYLFMYLLIGLFGTEAELIDKDFMTLGVQLVTGGDSAFQSINQAVQEFVGAMAANMGALGDTAAVISGLTVALIVSISILVGVFKLFFELLKTYITIVLMIAFSPLLLLMGAIPGKNVFGSWIQKLVGNLIVFPAVLLLLIMYQTLSRGEIGKGGFMPPYLLGQGAPAALTVLVGIGILLVLPESVKEIKKAFKADGGVWEMLAEKAIGNMKPGWEGQKILGVQVPGVKQGMSRGWELGKSGVKEVGVRAEKRILHGGGIRGLFKTRVEQKPRSADMPSPPPSGRETRRGNLSPSQRPITSVDDKYI